jgi:hypothetical protein
MKKDKNQIKSFYNFLEDTEGLTAEDMVSELKARGIDFAELKMKVATVVKRGSEKRRMAWRESAQLKRSEIEKLLERRETVSMLTDFKSKVKEILAGNFGQEALTYAEAYFRKKDSLTERDLESLIEDLEDLNLLDESGKKG